MSARMPRITAAVFIRALERDGWYFVRQRGAHRFYTRAIKPGLVVVPVHRGRTLKPGLVHDMLKDAGPRHPPTGGPAVRHYSVVVSPDTEEGGYTVRVPALPGCNTQGETLEEALSNAREAIEGYIETLVTLGRAVPEEREPPRCIVIEVAA